MNSPSSNPDIEVDVAPLPDADYAAFEQEFEALSGIKLWLYKENQMKRRINTLITRKGLNGYAALLAVMRSEPNEFSAFCDYITINVTEFFRTPEHWKYFETEALQELLKRGEEKLKVWSCACATGEEAYSAAISLTQLLPGPRFSILATDIDEKVLRQAEAGIYSEKSVESLPEEVLERYFTRSGAGWQVINEIRECVQFGRLDLLKDAYPRDIDLIICRNVLIYFTEEAKDEIYRKISGSLKPGGYLFTGNVEQIIYYRKYGFEKLTGYLYRKI